MAALVLVLLEKYDKAKEYSERAFMLNPSDTYVLLARGWSLLTPNDLSQNPGISF